MLKQVFARIARRSLRPFGYGIAPLSIIERRHHSLWYFAKSHDIDLVLDVGANEGQTGAQLRAAGYQGRIESFEPQSEAFRKLEQMARDDRNWRCHRLALGDADASLAMQLSEFSPSSSLLKMNDEHLKHWPQSNVRSTEQVTVKCLDALARDLLVTDRRTLLKIDAQGYEGKIIAGATSTLPYIKVAFVEVLFAPLYDGQATYYDVMKAFDRAGLRFAGLFSEVEDPKARLPICADAAFVRIV